MSWSWLLAGVVAAIIAVIFGGELLRLGKTLYLIARITPYEQSGIGEPRILIIGDSTGYGTGARIAPNSIAGRIGSSFPDATIVNHSQNGRRLDDLAKHINEVPGENEYDLVLLQMGANDILSKRPIDEVLKDLESIHRALAPKAKTIVLMTAGNVGGAPAFTGTKKADVYEQLSRDYYEHFEEFSEQRERFVFVDLFTEPKSDPFVKEPDRYIAIDGLHPSDAGYGLWYEKLFPVIEQALNDQ